MSLYVPHKARIELHLPENHPLRGTGYFTLRAGPENFRFRHIAHGVGTFEQSRELIAALRDRYGTKLAQQAPAGTKIEWCVDTGANQRNDQWYAEHPEGGYRELEPEDAAPWARAVCSTWVRLLADDPPIDLIEQSDPSR